MSLPFCLYTLEQYHGTGGDSLACARKTKFLLGRGLYADIVDIRAKVCGYIGTHGLYMRRHLRGLRYYGHVGIAKLPNTETVKVTDKAIGTVYYMSPEQARGKRVDIRTDVYSFGAMLYELCTGRTPFNGESPCDILVKHITDKPVPPRSINPNVPIGLEQIILCAMSKSPDDRFDSAAELFGYMKKLQKNKKIKFSDLPSNGFFTSLVGNIKGIFSKKKGKK